MTRVAKAVAGKGKSPAIGSPWNQLKTNKEAGGVKKTPMKKKGAANGVSPNGKPNTPAGKKQQPDAESSQKNAKTPQKNVKIQQQEVETTQKNVKTPKKNAKTPQKKVEAQQKEVETSQKNMETQQQEVETPQKNVKAPQKNAKTPQKKVEVQQKEEEELPQQKTENKFGNGLLDSNSRKRPLPDRFRCFRCNDFGHRFNECPTIPEGEKVIGCYKCGSTEHKSKACSKAGSDNYSFATCFRCQKQGHIVRDCPIAKDCRTCGSREHLMAECPENKKEKIEKGVVVDEIQEDENPDATEPSPKRAKKARPARTPKKVKF
ncbi:hypothetical protein CHUAL_006960 [Chamberlinius hualienensis]